MTDNTILETENIAETIRDVMSELGHHDPIETPADFDHTTAQLVSMPSQRSVENLTEKLRDAAQYLKPARRKGTATLTELQSLVGWTERFKSDDSVLFADPDMTAPTLTCVADYHSKGPSDCTTATGDPTARHCHHRGVYKFPLSNEWKEWMKISGKPQDKDVMGEFIEANAKDIMDPTPAIIKGKEDKNNEPWENRLIGTAQQIEGRFGQLSQLLAMSKKFQVFEKSDLKVVSNRDTGEAELQFLNEHQTIDGQPLVTPNLIIIAIPVFRGGAPYRMAVRFRYRKNGSAIEFALTIYNPEKVFEACFKEAVELAKNETGLPLFYGTPET